MKKEKKKAVMTQEDIMKMLDSLYDKTLNGIPKVSPNIEDFSKEYLDKFEDKEEAIKAMLKNQIIKCATSGFLTGFGGIITLPIAIPANIGSVVYVQMRMIASVAYMSGYDLKSDATQTFVYACLAGVSVNKLVKQVSVKFAVKFTNTLVKRIPGKVLTKINQKVGFRFLTKFGTKGLVNIGKMIPGVGAVVGGGLDYIETKVIADRAYKWFIDGNFSVDDKKSKDDDDILIPEDNVYNLENQIND